MTAYSLKGFIGPAGTGKTYNLVKEATALARNREWEPCQALLGLTFMHGARRRLDSRFSDLKKECIPIQCSTIDSFCLDIVRRFRIYLGYDRQVDVDTGIENCDHCECQQWNWVLSFDKMRLEMIRALQKQTVKKSIAASYPIIVVDEFQDCDGSLFDIVKTLSESSQVVVAADPFQRLEIENNTCDGTICDAVEWVKEYGEIVPLDSCKRTDKKDLLNTAEAMRLGLPKEKCILVRNFKAPGLAAFYISRALGQWGWGKGLEVVIITPVTESKSQFVAGVLKSLRKELGKADKFGPFPFYWEQTEGDQFQVICELLPNDDPDSGIIYRDELRNHKTSENKMLSDVCRSGLRVAALRGLEGISKSELTDIAKKRIHSRRAYCLSGRKRKRIVLTVHGAKNREFGCVFILWPRAMKKDTLHRRKLLYNAVTRASNKAMVLVEGNEKRIDSDDVLSLIKK